MSKVAIAVGVAVAGIAVLIIGLVVSSLKKLDSDEVALKYNTFQKTLSPNPEYEGLHMGPPGFTFITFPSVFRTLSFSNLRCLNLDGVTITISVSYQYRVRPSDMLKNVMEFKNYENYVQVLRHIGESGVHESCSKFNTSQFQSERGKFQEHLGDVLVRKYNDVTCDITDIQVNNINRPRQYENAIKSKEAAREDIEVAQNERPRRETEATTKKREALTQAGIIRDKAYSEARIITARATSQAEAIFNDYHKEAETYKALISGLGLNTEGFLAYMGVRTIADAQNPVYVGMKAPAKPSYVRP